MGVNLTDNEVGSPLSLFFRLEVFNLETVLFDRAMMGGGSVSLPAFLRSHSHPNLKRQWNITN